MNKMKSEFEAYINLALKEEINLLPEFYYARQGDFWIVTSNNELIGTFGLEAIDGNTAELRRMYVKKSFRRHGIATHMLAQFETESRSRGLSVATLSTSELQPQAIDFYKARGYIVVNEVTINEPSSKTVGNGILRYYFEKLLF